MSGVPSLRTFTTMKIGGTADLVVVLKDLHNLRQSMPKPVRVLGNGSNVLIDDHHLTGTVIIVREFPPAEPEVLSESKDAVLVRVSSGLFLPSLARWSSRRGYSGAEYMVGVPGTVGGALVQNAGANQQEFSDILVESQFFNLLDQSFETWSKEKCQLGYRSSVLKARPELLCLSVVIQLKRSSPEVIEQQIEKNLSYRKNKTPWTKPSLGSIYTRLRRQDDWLYPGELIESCGLKGFRIGGAEVSSVHANYIVNASHATFDDVIRVMTEVERRVLEERGVKLEREILIWSDRV